MDDERPEHTIRLAYDPNPGETQRVFEDGQGFCPICGQMLWPGAAEYCPHYLCIQGETGPSWFPDNVEDFGEITQRLVHGLSEVRDMRGFETIIDRKPAHITLPTHGDDMYWTWDKGIASADFSPYFTPYFHDDPVQYAHRINAEATAALGWLEQEVGPDWEDRDRYDEIEDEVEGQEEDDEYQEDES